MKTSTIPLAAILFLWGSTLTFAQDIYKCTTDAGISFQSAPCPENAAATRLTHLSTPIASHDADNDSDDDDNNAAPARKPAAAGYALNMYSRRDQLEPGMTDLQVLNNRRWGRPQNISRNRESGAWHEYWSYKTGANGGKKLHFINGVLSTVENLEVAAPPNTVVASQSASDTSANDAAKLVNAPTMVSAAMVLNR